MKVYIVSRGYPTEKDPLNGIFEFDQAKALVSVGCKVVFISVDIRSFRKKRALGVWCLTKDGVDIYNISAPTLGRSYKISNFIGRLSLLFVFNKAIKKWGYPDLVHAHFTRIAAMASVLKKTHKIPFVITEHSSKMTEPTLSKESIYYAKKAYFNADEVVCVSKSLADHLYEKFKINCKLIPNIVDTDKISYRPMDHSKFTFISVGNLIQRKGFDILLSAFRNMKNVDTQLHIIGSGEERGNLQNFINAHELNTRVKLLGYKNREEIAGIMNMGDAFVLASKRETFGVVFIEAMLAGLPVVATRCGGPENFINKSNGILVEIDNINELSTAMDKICKTRELYNSKWISDNCISQFSPNTVAKHLCSVYEEVLKSNSTKEDLHKF